MGHTNKKRLTEAQREQAKRLAFVLYTENGFEQKVISQITGISEVSISSWKKEGNWDDEREQMRMGPEKEMRRIRALINAQLDQIEKRPAPDNHPNSAEADAINKLSDAIRKLQGQTLTIVHKSETGKLFVSYIQQVYGQAKAVEIVELWHEFIMATS